MDVLPVLDSLSACGEGGVFRSTNSGAEWTPVNRGTTRSSTQAFAVIGSAFFAGTFGVLCITDDGNSWTPANTGVDEHLG